jgi:hypothetical protein
MSSNKSGADMKRRGFLLAGSVGAAGAVAVAIVPAVKPTVPAVAKKAAPDGAGYQDTEHVRTYYDLARV